MTSRMSSSSFAPAQNIQGVDAHEAFRLMSESLSRFVKLIESLAPEDWSKPTPCAEWDVHDIVAHQAGGYASGAGYRQMMRQYIRLPQKGQLPEDAINAFQVKQRKNNSPAELIAELKRVGPLAVQKWAYGFRAIKWVAFAHPIAGNLKIRDLMWITHSRDTWMHRLDICRATNRSFELSNAHDGRIVELVVRDVSNKLRRRLAGRAITLTLMGTAGGAWLIGDGEPAAGLQMDALRFNNFASGRLFYSEALEQAEINGDRALLNDTFKDLLILY